MKKILTIYLSLLILSVTVGGILVGCNCGHSDDGTRLELSLNVNETTLTRLWDTIVDETGVQPETAHIARFILNSDPNGEIQRVLFIIDGINNENQQTAYFVEINNQEHQKRLTVNEQVSESSINSSNPGLFFSEIDKFGLTNLQSETDGISISIVDIFSGLDYHSDEKYALLYELNEGMLIPLQRIKFKQEPYIYGIRVYRNSPEGPSYPVQYWFLEQELEKTDIVDYENN